MSKSGFLGLSICLLPKISQRRIAVKIYINYFNVKLKQVLSHLKNSSIDIWRKQRHCVRHNYKRKIWSKDYENVLVHKLRNRM